MQSQHKDAIDTQLCVRDGKMLNSEYEFSEGKERCIAELGSVSFTLWA